jgi:Neuraminidase (sialidase)
MKEKKLLCDNIKWLQMQGSDLKVAMCVLEENLLFSSHRAQVAENQTEALIIRLVELQRKFKSQRVSAVKGKEWDLKTWDGDVWEDHVEAENFESSDSQGFAPPEEVVPHPLK